MDDTIGKIQIQVKSDHQHSQLSLGHITRIEDNAGRKDARGEGFELRTDGHGVMRAADGMLISTEARPRANAHITDMAETVARLTQGRSLHETLGDAARQARAQDAGDQDKVADALKAHVASIKGAANGDPATGRFPEFDDPHLVVASPAGIESTSAQSTHLHAGEHIALTSEAHASISAGQSILASARKAIRLFAYETGARLFAFGGDIEIKALKDSISILAKLNITQTAETIDICASKKLTLNGGGSTITLEASGIAEATGGPHRVFAVLHSKVGPKNAPTRPVSGDSSLKELPPGQMMISMRSHGADGWPLANEPYTLYRDGAMVERGISDAAGQIHIDKHVPGSVGKYPPQPVPALSPLAQNAQALGSKPGIKEQLAALGIRSLVASLWTFDSEHMSKQKEELDMLDTWERTAIRNPAFLDANGVNNDFYGGGRPRMKRDKLFKDRYREIYIHAKLLMIDDGFFTLGSANLNQRSMASDSEINVATDDPGEARELRQRVWGMHTGNAAKCNPASNDDKLIADAFWAWEKLLEKNAKAKKDGEAFKGFLVPFHDDRSTNISAG